MRQVALPVIAEYAAEDADITLRLKHYFAPKLEQEELLPLFRDIEMPLVYVLADMEATGVTLDTEALRQSSEVLTAQLSEIEQEIYEMADMTFNINSTRQVGEVLFDRLKLNE